MEHLSYRHVAELCAIVVIGLLFLRAFIHERANNLGLVAALSHLRRTIDRCKDLHPVLASLAQDPRVVISDDAIASRHLTVHSARVEQLAEGLGRAALAAHYKKDRLMYANAYLELTSLLQHSYKRPRLNEELDIHESIVAMANDLRPRIASLPPYAAVPLYTAGDMITCSEGRTFRAIDTDPCGTLDIVKGKTSKASSDGNEVSPETKGDVKEHVSCHLSEMG